MMKMLLLLLLLPCVVAWRAVSVDSTGSSSGVGIEEELLTLELSIKQQQRKLELLRSLRAANVTLPPLDAPAFCSELHVALLATGVDCGGFAEKPAPRGNRRPSPPDDDEDDADELDARRRRRRRLSGDDETSFEDVVLDKLEFAPEAKVAAVEMMAMRARSTPQSRTSSGRRRSGPPPATPYVNVMAVAYVNGTVEILEPASGERLVSFESGLKSVELLAFEGTDEPLLLVGSQNEANLFNMTLWRHEFVLAGRRPRRPRRSKEEIASGEDEEEEPKRSGPERRTASGLGVEMRLETRVTEAPEVQITALGVFATRVVQSRVLVVADSLGVVRLHARNGTLLRQEQVTQGPLHVMKRAGSALALGEGSNVAFVGSTRLQKLKTFCQGNSAPITSMAYDALSPATLYVGYANGDLVAFNTRARSSQQQQQQQHPGCRLNQKLPGSVHSGPVKLASLRGFLISASPNLLAIHNTTDGLRLVATKKLNATLFAASFASGMHMSEILFATLADDKLSVFESLLRYQHPTSDITWLRMPILIIGLIVVFGFQMFREQNKGRGGYRGGGGGGGMPAGMMEAMSQMGGGGGGDDGFPGGAAGLDSVMGGGFDRGGGGGGSRRSASSRSSSGAGPRRFAD